MPGQFLEFQFPTDISQGAIGGPGFNTTVNEFSSGDEQRNINWVFSKGSWDVSKGLRTQEQVEVLISIFNNCRGRAYAFRFKDWTDYRCPRWRSTPGDMGGIPVFMTTNGSQQTFQLFKPYGNYNRPIYKPVNVAICSAGCYPLALQANAVPIINPTDFTVDTTTGIVTLSSALATTSGVAISGAFEFDVPVRFDTDQQKLSITTTENMGWPAIPIVETRDY